MNPANYENNGLGRTESHNASRSSVGGLMDLVVLYGIVFDIDSNDSTFSALPDLVVCALILYLKSFTLRG